MQSLLQLLKAITQRSQREIAKSCIAKVPDSLTKPSSKYQLSNTRLLAQVILSSRISQSLQHCISFVAVLSAGIMMASDQAFAQSITPTTNTPALQSALTGVVSGVTVSNVVITSNVSGASNINGVGTFSNAGGFTGGGIVLRTGKLGERTVTTGGSGCTTSCDITTIEFDVVPQYNNFGVGYSFFSWEYLEYVNTQYNDNIDIVVTGPGLPTAGANLATVPNSTTPIQINTVNHVTNSPFFVRAGCSLNTCTDSTAAGAEFNMDGGTVPLRNYTSQIQRGQNYHVKITINDVADNRKDSQAYIGLLASNPPDTTISKAVSTTGPVNPGTELTYTITLTNRGTSSDVVNVSDSIPANSTYVTGSASNGGVLSGQSITWSNLTVPAGTCANVACTSINPSTLTLTFKVTAGSGSASIQNSASFATTLPYTPSSTTSNTVTTAASVADLSITKTDSPDPAIAGANLTYTIAATNNGSSTATNTTISDPLPIGTTFQSITAPSGWNCTTPAVGSNGTVNCTNAAFAVGSANFTVVVKVDPSTASGTTLTNTATVSSSTADINTSNNSSSQTTTVQQSADLRLSKTSNPSNPAVLSNFDYIITVTNDGPSTATNVQVKDQLPVGVGYVLNTPTQGTYDSITGIWSVGTLNSGASATLTIRATRNIAGNTVNTAEVIAADQPDPDSPHNNQVAGEDDQDSVTVPNQSVDLAVAKTVDNSTPSVGQNVTFTVTVTNPSTGNATNVGLTDILPAGLTYQSHTVTTGTYNTSSGAWSVGTLNSGATATLTMVARVTTSGAKTNTAQLSALNETDTNTANNQSSVTVTSPSPKMSLVKRITAINGAPFSGFDGTASDPNSNGNTSEDAYWPQSFDNYLRGRIDGGKVKPGDEVEYTIYFLNSQNPATEVEVCDLVPTNTTFISTGFNTASPHPTELGALAAADTGIALVLYPANATTLPNPPSPTVYLTNIADSDRGQYFTPNDPNTPSSCRNVSNNLVGAAANTNGAVVVNVIRSTDPAPNDTLPYATGSGTPPRSYGFVRLRVRVN